MTTAGLSEELLRLLLASEEGISDEQIRSHFGGRYEQLVPAINDLLASNRLLLFTQAGSLVYKAVKEETAMKFEGLGPEQMLVYQAIERSGNKGIWTRDIKTATNIPQHTLAKTLKILEQRQLVKSVRSVVSKSKKLYMAYDMMPAKEITGGPWYSDQEFDHEFVGALSNFIVQIVKNMGMVDLPTLTEKVRISGISKVELSQEELELVVNTLVYDGRLEEVSSAVVLMTGQSTARKRFKVCKSGSMGWEYLTETPCGRCPVLHQCSEGGIISPSSCEYYNEWLTNAQELQKSLLYASNVDNNGTADHPGTLAGSTTREDYESMMSW
eukprot:gene2818-3072_t